MNISTVTFKKSKKSAKNSQLCHFVNFVCPNISAYKFFTDMRFVAANSKYRVVSHIFDLGRLNDAHLGPVGSGSA